jgi:hypothetical protein
MPAPLSDLVVWEKSQQVTPTEMQLVVKTVLQALVTIHDTVVYQMGTINDLCEKYGLDMILNELPKEQQEQFKDTIATIQTAWTEIGSDPVPELAMAAKV